MKTVKEWIEEYTPQIMEYKIGNIQILCLLDDILESYEKELAEKDKLIASAEARIESAYEKILIKKEQEINSFKQQIDMAHNFNQNLGSEIEELKQQQLYKEDFADYEITCQCKSEDCDFPGATIKYLKDISKYYNLPGKEELK